MSIGSQRAARNGVRVLAALTTLFALSVSGLTTVSGSPPAAPEVTPELATLLEGLDQAGQSIRNVSVTTDYVKRQLFSLPVDKPVEMKLTTRAVLDSAGRVRSETDGQQVNLDPDGKSVRLYRGRWVRVFQNGESRGIDWYEGNLSGASLSDVLTWHGIDPREFTTHYQRKPVAEIIRKRGACIAGRVEWDGRSVFLVETVPVGDEQQRRYRFWIDGERNIVVRRAMAIRFQPSQPWQEYTRIEGRGHREILPAVWLPMRVKYESVDVTMDRSPETLSWSYEGLNRDWEVNRKLAADAFELEFPEGARVNDHRSGK